MGPSRAESDAPTEGPYMAVARLNIMSRVVMDEDANGFKLPVAPLETAAGRRAGVLRRSSINGLADRH
jgi:hypothetical protein